MQVHVGEGSFFCTQYLTQISPTNFTHLLFAPSGSPVAPHECSLCFPLLHTEVDTSGGAYAAERNVKSSSVGQMRVPGFLFWKWEQRWDPGELVSHNITLT